MVSIIENPDNDLFVSIVSIWELAIKVKLGKLHLPCPVQGIADKLRDRGVNLIPIYEKHAIFAGFLPLHHRDPFDRMLIAQAQLERLTLVTCDSVFDQYGVKKIW